MDCPLEVPLEVQRKALKGRRSTVEVFLRPFRETCPFQKTSPIFKQAGEEECSRLQEKSRFERLSE